MNDSPQARNEHPDSTIDGEIAEILDQYLTAREAGTACDREAWLKQFPQHAERLAACLDAAERFGAAEAGNLDLSQEIGFPESIGDFEIVREIGRGGMGVVYEAREKSLDRIVALKVMRFGIVDPMALDRFRREAETAGALHHTNIVPVYATGRQGDTSWYAMQFIQGESLADRLARFSHDGRTPTIDEVLDVGIQAAEALDHAHRRDVIHRDVKPANLIMDREDRVWLTDFGLARRLVDAGATVTGAILGTPRYMSPEQADLRTTDVDHRCDIYSLGATLYEMATGRPPHDGNDPLTIITKIRYEEPPSIRTLRRDLPRDLEVVLQKAMEKDAKRRYQTAAEFAEDLRAIREDHPITARPLSLLERGARAVRKHQSRFQAAAIAMIATTLLLIAALYSVDQIQKSRLGSFRIRAGDGPYHATILPHPAPVASESTIELTLPMQEHRELIAGDYDIRVAPRGRWSRMHRLPISKGVSSDYRITGHADEPIQISIKDALAVTVQDPSSPAILWRRQGVLKKFAPDPSRSWQRDVSAVETIVETLGPEQNRSDDETTEVDFAMTRQPANHDRGHHFLADDPLLTQGVAAFKEPIDLNADGRADSLVAATDQQALLALDHRGQVLWARGYQFAGKPIRSQLPAPFLRNENIPVPGVFDLQAVGDRDDDGVTDFFVMLVHLQMSGTTDVCLATISGKTGAVIRWDLQSFTPPQGTFWPADGVFHPGKHEYRNVSGLSFNRERAYRPGTRSTNDFVLRSQPNSTPVRIAVPSPPLLIRNSDRFDVVLLVGDQCQIIDWDAPASSRAFQLPFQPARAPVLANRGEDARLIFHDHETSSSKSAPVSGTQMVAFDLQGKLRWSRHLEHIQWRNAIDQNHADWPLAEDLDGDGKAELIVPRSGFLNGVELGIELMDAASGVRRWDPDLPMTALDSASSAISRITVTDDIDGDGWNDLATATLSGQIRSAGFDGPDRREAHVYVDWISGKTGKPLSWARHRIALMGKQKIVAQVDAIRGRIEGDLPGTVEIDLVTGEQTLDVMLTAEVVRFQPDQPRPIAIASGLDACDSTAPPSSDVRVFRRRGGPFGIGDDDLTFLATPDWPRSRLGESVPLASWTDSSGRDLLAVTGFEPQRISVIDAGAGKTLWTQASEEVNSSGWLPVRHIDGRIDFLWQGSGGDKSPAMLLDGETGAVRWRISQPLSGRVVMVKPIKGSANAIFVSDGSFRESVNATGTNRPVDAFEMSLVHLASGTVRWTGDFLYGAARINTPREFDDLELVDMNGDGVMDLVGPDAHDNELFLAAWNGNDGQRIWEFPLHAVPYQTDYWAPFCVVAIDGNPQVVVVGHDAEEPSRSQLILLGRDGRRVASDNLSDLPSLSSFSRRYRYRNVAIANATAETGPPLVALSYADRGDGHLRVYDLSERLFQQISHFSDSEQATEIEGMWFADVDGDGAFERISIVRSYGSTESRDGETGIPPRLLIRCHGILETSPRCELEIEGVYQVSDVNWKWDHGSPVTWIECGSERLVAVDWRRQKLIEGMKLFEPDESILPIVWHRDQHSTLFAVPTVDGIEFQNSPPKFDADQTRSHSLVDPRRRVALFDSIGGSKTLTQWVTHLLRSTVFLAVLVMLPLWYVTQTLRDRRWGLSWMLLLPLIVGMWIVAWKSTWIDESNRMLILINGAAVWMCAGAALIAFRKRTDRQGLSIRRMLVVGTPVVFIAFALTEWLQRDDPTLHYYTEAADLVRVSAISFALVAQVYWVFRVPVSIAAWLRGRRVT